MTRGYSGTGASASGAATSFFVRSVSSFMLAEGHGLTGR